jgi:ATP-binding protein involved in chromosome partitioning
MSNSIDEAAVRAALAEFKDPETGRSVMQMEQVRDLRVSGDRISLTLALSTHSAPLWQDTQQELGDFLRARFSGVQAIDVQLGVLDRPASRQGELGVTAKSIIAVGSGKGGVGKSTIAASIALGLGRAGSKVGLMDADVYGPSIPHLLGVQQMPPPEQNRLLPAEAAGIKVMSMGFLVPAAEAVVWRGPMLHKAVQQFLGGTAWGDLDYLIVDMPPGTGDVALSLSQSVPLTGAIVVCTPQDVALLDAVKAIAMFRKVNIPVLGMVENMSYFMCPSCNKRYDIFGSGGAKKRAEEMDIPYLGEVPINIRIRVHGDEGRTAENFNDVDSAPFLESICHRLVKNLAEQNRKRPPLPTLSVL